MLYILCFLWFYKDNETSLQNYLLGFPISSILGLLGLVVIQKRSYKLKKVQCTATWESVRWSTKHNLSIRKSISVSKVAEPERSSYTFLPISKGLTSCEWASWSPPVSPPPNLFSYNYSWGQLVIYLGPFLALLSLFNPLYFGIKCSLTFWKQAKAVSVWHC